MVSHEQFELASCQASIFTPDEGLPVARIMAAVFPDVAGIFDAEPVVLPPIPVGAPPEIPRILLKSANECWSCDIAAGRINVYWRRPVENHTPPVTIADFYARCTEILQIYRRTISVPVNRIAAVLIRFSKQDSPGVSLATHFCKDRWLIAPLNRPENFEMHAHKKFVMGGEFQVNSWARAKTALLADSESPIITFEQDINTLAEAVATTSFDEDQISHFFQAVSPEFEAIIKLYFPDQLC